MSLIDPSTRWWNRESVRGIIVWVCYGLSIALAFIGGFGFTAEFQQEPIVPTWVGLVGSIGYLPLLLAGCFLKSFGMEQKAGDTLQYLSVLALCFIAVGLGSILVPGSQLHGVMISFVVLGVIALMVFWLIARRGASNRVIEEQVKRSGVSTTGTVTRAYEFSINYSPVTRVTVKFTDTQGRSRWVSETIGGSISKGSQLKVRYLPAQIDRSKAAVMISR